MNKISFLTDLCLREILFANTYFARKTDYPMQNAGRSSHGLLFTVKGTEVYHFNDATIPAVPGSILYIPKGEQYKIELHDECSEVITIDFETIGECPRPFVVQFREHAVVGTYFSDIQKQWNRLHVGYSVTCKSVFYKIIAQMIQNESVYKNTARYIKIQDAIEYLHAHYTDCDFKMDILYQTADMSSKYFETLFKENYNMTPKEYVLHLKIERAKHLLLNEKNSVGGIALQLGYKDIYHFGKLFKLKTGYTPTEFRTIYKKKPFV